MPMKSALTIPMVRRMVKIAATLILFMATASALHAGGLDSLDRLLRRMEPQLALELPDHVRATYLKIPDFSRRLLALNCYLRRADELHSDWSWTQNEIDAFKKSVEYDTMLADVAAVQREFAARNPGYHLKVNIGARSLGTQLTKWNQVSSVKRAGDECIDSLRLKIDSAHATLAPGDTLTYDAFRTIFLVYEPDSMRVPTVAVPGLSKHGQLKAFDFKVYRGGTMIAGATSSTIQKQWERTGWTDKLVEAVAAVSRRFDGPLKEPYEPWHYNYEPDRFAVDVDLVADSSDVSVDGSPSSVTPTNP